MDPLHPLNGLQPLLQFSPGPSAPTYLMLALGIGWWVLMIFVNLMFAAGVSRHARGRRLVLVGRGMWVLATVAGGPITAAAYWIVNASSLSSPHAGKS